MRCSCFPREQYCLRAMNNFAFCFFQCLVWRADGHGVLTRSADLRRRIAPRSSRYPHLNDGPMPPRRRAVRRWASHLGLAGHALGRRIEYSRPDSSQRQEAWRLPSRARRRSSTLRHVAFPGREAPAGDRLRGGVCRALGRADAAAIALLLPGIDEVYILSAMHERSSVRRYYPRNEFIIGSGEDALRAATHRDGAKLDATTS